MGLVAKFKKRIKNDYCKQIWKLKFHNKVSTYKFLIAKTKKWNEYLNYNPIFFSLSIWNLILFNDKILLINFEYFIT